MKRGVDKTVLFCYNYNMNDNLVPEKLFHLRMLNDNILKQDESQFIIKNIRISPAGVLEAERAFADVSFTVKIFYNDKFYITELTTEEVADFYDSGCDHNDDMESQDDD